MSSRSLSIYVIFLGLFCGIIICESKRILKVFLMTRNEWPLVKSNILYHGDLFGFSNVHVIDASTDKVVVNFLKKAQKELNLQVHFSSAGLRSVVKEINNLMHQNKENCSYFIKIDTDELITYYDPNKKTISIDRDVIQDYLDQLVYDGAKYQVGWSADNMIQLGCKDSEDSFITETTFHPVTKTTFKTFFPSFSFKDLDLGSHHGNVLPQYNNISTHATNLNILHYHWQCFGRMIQATKQAVIRTGYLKGNETREESIYILGNMSYDFPQKCRVSSCHKVYQLWQYLLRPKETEKEYYSDSGYFSDILWFLQRGSMASATYNREKNVAKTSSQMSSIRFSGIRDKLIQLNNDFLATLA